MRKFYFLFTILLTAAVIASCRKEATVPQQPQEQGEDPGQGQEEEPQLPQGYLVEVLDTTVYETADDFVDFIASTYFLMADYEEIFREVVDPIMKIGAAETYVRQIIQGKTANVRIHRYNFTYRSLDTDGQPCIFSGSLVLPNSDNPEYRCRLDAVTLYHSFYISKYDCATGSGVPAMARAIFNQAVVSSDFQGMGVDEGTHHHPFLEYFSLARQSIDCEMAALELMGRLNVRLPERFPTYNMAISKGAPVVIAAHKLVQESEDEDIKKSIRIASSYACAGPCDLVGLLKAYGTDIDLVNIWMISMMVLSVYYSHPEEFPGVDILDFFSENYRNAIIPVGGVNCFVHEYVDLMVSNQNFITADALDAVGIHRAQDMLNPRFFNEDESYNMNDPLVATFFRLLGDCNPCTGWIPKSTVLMETGRNDRFIVYDVANNCYLTLRGGLPIPNPLVRMNTWQDLDHGNMSIVGMVKIMALPDPTLL